MGMIGGRSMKNLEIIAEFGTNHVDPNGKVLENIEDLIHTLADKGATAVKFQLFKADNLVEKNTEVHGLIKNLEIALEEHVRLKKICEEIGLRYLCTPFCVESLDALLSIGVKEIKIASCDCGNLQLMSDIVQRHNKIHRVIMATGMSTLNEIGVSIDILIDGGFNIDLLHCTSVYPTPIYRASLDMIRVLKKKWGLFNIGYSDHTLGTEVVGIARAMGCTIFEKHVTPDRTMPGFDHAYSFPIDEFDKYVDAIKNVDQIIGEERKYVDKKEAVSRDAMKRGIWFKKEVFKGQKITRDDIIVRRPLKGAVNQTYYFSVLGKKVKKNFNEDDPVLTENLYE